MYWIDSFSRAFYAIQNGRAGLSGYIDHDCYLHEDLVGVARHHHIARNTGDPPTTHTIATQSVDMYTALQFSALG